MPERSRAHPSPRTAVVWSVLRAELDRRAKCGSSALTALDVGGGSGVFAVPLAEMGVSVTVVDTSADALATLARRALEAGVASQISPIQGDADRLSEVTLPGSFDLVLCHSVLEIVDDAQATVATIASVLRPGGCASLLVANRAATVLARAISGRLTEALRALDDESGRWGEGDGVRCRFDTASLTALLGFAGLTVEQLHGVRVVADLVPGALLDGVPGAADALYELEFAACATAPYRDVATQLHALARRG